MNEMLSTPEDVGAAQFGTSGITNLMAAQAMGTSPSNVGFTSVSADPRMQAAGGCTPIELSTYMNDMTSGPFASGSLFANILRGSGFEFLSFGMSAAEAKAFLTTFSDATGVPAGMPNWIAVFGGLAKKFAVTGSQIEPLHANIQREFDQQRKADSSFKRKPFGIYTSQGLPLEQYTISYVNRLIG